MQRESSEKSAYNGEGSQLIANKSTLFYSLSFASFLFLILPFSSSLYLSSFLSFLPSFFFLSVFFSTLLSFFGFPVPATRHPASR